MRVREAVAYTIALPIFGATLALGFYSQPGVAHADPIQEDSPGWSCVDDGNHICGVGNTNGVPAGCYDEGGVRVAVLPCHWEEGKDGFRYLYTHTGEVERYFPLDTDPLTFLLGHPDVTPTQAASWLELMAH